MNKSRIKVLLCIFFLLFFFYFSVSDVRAETLKELPVKGMVTMIDLGAKKCIPCRMMLPIMEKMEKAYKKNAAIVFIDVWENKDQAKRFGVRAIPTQIFFNPEGKEVYRHVGFMSEKEIVAQFKKMGVE
ncbi:MAG: thioredoxin family protein [Deltaproteobacteria bacterium]|nr:thioredoxin family protein [Deltaproteobacteria bacterium]